MSGMQRRSASAGRVFWCSYRCSAQVSDSASRSTVDKQTYKRQSFARISFEKLLAANESGYVRGNAKLMVGGIDVLGSSLRAI